MSCFGTVAVHLALKLIWSVHSSNTTHLKRLHSSQGHVCGSSMVHKQQNVARASSLVVETRGSLRCCFSAVTPTSGTSYKIDIEV